MNQQYQVPRPPLWLRGNIIVSHVTGLGSIPGRVSVPSTVREMSETLRPVYTCIYKRGPGKCHAYKGFSVYCRRVIKRLRTALSCEC